MLAFQEGEDALVAYAQDQVQRDELITAVGANQRAADRALQRYVQGLTDFLSVLQAQLNLFTSQDQLAQSRRDIALDLVALYKALGGGRDVASHSGTSSVAYLEEKAAERHIVSSQADVDAAPVAKSS